MVYTIVGVVTLCCVVVCYVYWATVRLIGWAVLKGVWIACMISAGTWLFASMAGDSGFAGKLAIAAIIPGAIFGWIMYGEIALGLWRERSVQTSGAMHVIKSHAK